jgi:hypothetical protein
MQVGSHDVHGPLTLFWDNISRAKYLFFSQTQCSGAMGSEFSGFGRCLCDGYPSLALRTTSYMQRIMIMDSPSQKVISHVTQQKF